MSLRSLSTKVYASRCHQPRPWPRHWPPAHRSTHSPSKLPHADHQQFQVGSHHSHFQPLSAEYSADFQRPTYRPPCQSRLHLVENQKARSRHFFQSFLYVAKPQGFEFFPREHRYALGRAPWLLRCPQLDRRKRIHHIHPARADLQTQWDLWPHQFPAKPQGLSPQSGSSLDRHWPIATGFETPMVAPQYRARRARLGFRPPPRCHYRPGRQPEKNPSKRPRRRSSPYDRLGLLADCRVLQQRPV